MSGAAQAPRAQVRSEEKEDVMQSKSMRKLLLKLRVWRGRRDGLWERTRKLQDALNSANGLKLTGKFQSDLPTLNAWWNEFRDWEKVMGESIRYFEGAMSRDPGAENPAGFPTSTSWMRDRVGERMQILFDNFQRELVRTNSDIEVFRKEIYELRLKEDGLGLTRASLRKSDRAFYFSIGVLILTILIGVATKVFEPSLVWLQHHLPQIHDRPAAASPASRAPPLSFLK